MPALHTFQAIASQTLGALITVWPFTLVAFAAAALAYITGARATHTRPWARRLLMLAVYVLPVITMLIGALLAYDAPRDSTYEQPSAWKGMVLWVPLLACGACIVVLAMRAHGDRLRTIALTVPAVWLILCSTIVAGMAIAGVGA
jgi:fucose 4-O-acetylase-like acetyltransferase